MSLSYQEMNWYEDSELAQVEAWLIEILHDSELSSFHQRANELVDYYERNHSGWNTWYLMEEWSDFMDEAEKLSSLISSYTEKNKLDTCADPVVPVPLVYERVGIWMPHVEKYEPLVMA